MNICIVLVAHNRLEYTRKALSRLLQDPNEEFELYLWDNASSDETGEYLADGVQDPRIVEVILSKQNVGQTGAMNHVWNKTKAELVGKVDNDCLVTSGWTRTFAGAHKDIARLGAVACWHYPSDEFDENAARKAGKIQRFGQHQLLRHPYVCGSGFIMKRKTYRKYGLWEPGPDIGTTYYFLKMALGGEINGWYYPFVLQEHMDDPKSTHCLLTDDEAVMRMYDTTYTLRVQKIKDMKRRWARRRHVLKGLNSDPWEAKYYVGWRKAIRRILMRVEKVSNFIRK